MSKRESSTANSSVDAAEPPAKRARVDAAISNGSGIDNGVAVSNGSNEIENNNSLSDASDVGSPPLFPQTNNRRIATDGSNVTHSRDTSYANSNDTIVDDSTSSVELLLRHASVVQPDTFDVHEVFYPRAVNSTLHPMVATFFTLGNDRIVERYCHLNPSVSAAALTKILATCPRYFRWSGADLFNVSMHSAQCK